MKSGFSSHPRGSGAGVGGAGNSDQPVLGSVAPFRGLSSCSPLPHLRKGFLLPCFSSPGLSRAPPLPQRVFGGACFWYLLWRWALAPGREVGCLSTLVGGIDAHSSSPHREVSSGSVLSPPHVISQTQAAFATRAQKSHLEPLPSRRPLGVLPLGTDT